VPQAIATRTTLPVVLTRYTMYRGKRPAADPLPSGVRVDTRRHTGHCLRPARELVDVYLDDPSDEAWTRFAAAYRAGLEERIAADDAPFVALAERATEEDVYIGCSCPTRKNPDVHRCHTVLALHFMAEQYPDLEVVLPH